MSLWTVVHEHRFGTTAYVVDYTEVPTESQLVRCLNLDFEPSREETLSIYLLDTDEPKRLDWQAGDEREYHDV